MDGSQTSTFGLAALSTSSKHLGANSFMPLGVLLSLSSTRVRVAASLSRHLPTAQARWSRPLLSGRRL